MRSNMSPSLRCKFFVQGSCRNGASCLFFHNTAEARQASSTSGDDHECALEGPLEAPLASELDAHETQDTAVSLNTDQPPIPQASPHAAAPPPARASSPHVATVILAEAAIFEPCTFHLTGRCARGDSCAVRHYEPVNQTYSPIPSVSPLIGDLKGDDGDWIQFSEAVARASNYDDRPPCTFFAKGLCNMGDHCRFRHDLAGSSSPTTPPGSVLRPCKYFAEGACAKGLMCPFLHDIRAQNASVPAPEATVDDAHKAPGRPCRYYSQGKCRMGSKCRFQHDLIRNDSTQIRSPSPGLEEQATNWVLDTDDNPAWATDQQVASKWGDEEQATDWVLDTDDNSAWATDPQIASKWSDEEPVRENSGPGWFEETDENPEWNIDQQDASKWTMDSPPRTSGRRPDNDSTDAARFPSSVKDLGAEQSWDLPWPDAVPDVKSPPKAYCKYYGQGYCYAGDACAFLHVGDQTSQQRDADLGEQNVDASQQHPITHPITQSVLLPEPEHDLPPQSIYRCMVRFGAGAIPEQVVTPFESHGVMLSNYPPGMAHDDLLRLAEPYGGVKNTTFRLLPGGVQAHIEYEENSQAAEAALNLNGITIDELVIRAQLDSVGSFGGSVHEPGAERQIKLVWDAPSVSAWAFYPNVRTAKDESVRLDGMMYEARKITAEYRKPSQKHSIPVLLTGLPQNVTREALHAFCAGSSSVSLNAPNYLQSPNENILACLAEFGPIDSFEVLPTDASHHKVTAFAKFYTAKAAASCVRVLKGMQHAFLGKGCISVQPVYHTKYDCANGPLALIRDDLDRLRDSCADSACTILYYEQPPCVHLYGRQADAMAQVRNSVQVLIFGFELACWDPYFDTASGEEALKRINADTSFYIRRDHRHRVLRIWGNRDKGEKQITRLLKQVHAKRHSLRVDQNSVPVLLDGGLKSLQDAFGASKVLFDLRSQTITALGDIKIEAERHLEVLTSEYSRGTGNCCLCFSDAAVAHVELPCTHIYCSACLKFLMRPIPGIDFATPRCIAEVGPDQPTSQCLAAIPTSVISSQLPDEDQAQLFESALLSFVRSESDFHFCISGCRVLYRSGIPGAVFTCSDCSLDICAACAVPVHTGLTCADYRALGESE
ncbi:hypothetical protein DFH09DRAFT_182335 [Mycena vulgaris]|nr:hypothetical protein DFH09DRAFT_182335 [Mycena vulgaris]